MPDIPCSAVCFVLGGEIQCELQSHVYEHEATLVITVGEGDDEQDTPFLIWWGDDGHAFVGSKDAVNTGSIG